MPYPFYACLAVQSRLLVHVILGQIEQKTRKLCGWKDLGWPTNRLYFSYFSYMLRIFHLAITTAYRLPAAKDVERVDLLMTGSPFR